jgi:hypothetical protein
MASIVHNLLPDAGMESNIYANDQGLKLSLGCHHRNIPSIPFDKWDFFQSPVQLFQK